MTEVGELPSDGVNQYRRWFEYERESHAKVLAVFEKAPDAVRASAQFQRAVDLLAHVAAARLLWLWRFGARSERPAALFPTNITLARVSADIATMQAEWNDFLAQSSDSSIDRMFEYQATDGPRFRNSVRDVLTQLFGHSLYHRGQIALLMRQAGVDPAVTDFIFWAREPLDG